MKDENLEVMFARVRGWDEERKQQAFELLLALEKYGDVLYPLTEEEAADIAEGVAEAERGEFATPEEIARVFRRSP
jgi:hypothetical protein